MGEKPPCPRMLLQRSGLPCQLASTMHAAWWRTGRCAAGDPMAAYWAMKQPMAPPRPGPLCLPPDFTPVQLETHSLIRDSASPADSGHLECWGPDEASVRHGVPDPDASWLAVAAGDYHTCGTLRNGTVRCWGCKVLNIGQCDGPTP